MVQRVLDSGVATIDIDRLAAEISPEAPCGENLEYDADFINLEQALRGKPERQFGKTVVPAEGPSWPDVARLALGLLERSKDLRLYVILTRALMRNSGFIGLNYGLGLLHSAIGAYWGDVHPRLDADDAYDPTARVNLIASLCDPDTVLRPLRDVPLVSSRNFGRIGLRHLAIASGASAGAEPAPTPSDIEAAFLEVSLDELKATAEAVRSAGGHVQGIETVLTEKVGAGNAVSLDPLVRLLNEADRVLTDRLAARGVDAPGSEGDGQEGGEPEDNGAEASADPEFREAGAPAPRIGGRITNREDVIRALDQLCQYYERHEPASPVPLLLQRAKRLVPMSFMDILDDMKPDITGTANAFRGPQAST
jgi:type VI secretion system protein ImpA